MNSDETGHSAPADYDFVKSKALSVRKARIRTRSVLALATLKKATSPGSVTWRARACPGQNDRAAWPQLASRFAPEFATGTRDEWVAVFAGLDARVSGPAGDRDTADALRR
jgi:hypothetical protein